MEQATIAPIVKSVTVNCSQEQAFRVFTQRFGEWWPLRTHSMGEENAESAVLEPRVGGRIYELNRGGQEGYWGTVTLWDPPNRLEFDWQVNPTAPGPTHVAVCFTPQGETTVVELEHGRWEIHGPQADEARGSYASEGGWALVLEGFARMANSRSD
ncbi:MAG TPA: SRPBCC family protein [Actinomycetota bacterium]|nr:SRPBCC family protein [Actinomycetota bacterium]